MKKWLVFFSLAGLLSAACAKQEMAPKENIEPTPGTYVFTLKASMDSELTKTSYEGDKTFSWSAGDQISVLFHNGDDNKYFTLTTSGTGPSASFSGEITEGYTIGSSFNADEKIAFFPAAAHSYDRTKAKYDPSSYPRRGPYFHIPAFTDFTKTHFSANLPMAAIGDGDNNFSFKHIAGTYKVVFGSIDPSVTKVMLHVENQLAYAISGDFRLEDGGSYNYCWWQTWTSDATAKTLSYVVNVDPSTHKATFYVPYCHNDAEGFQPTFTLTNAVNGNMLAKASAKAAFSGDNKPNRDHMVILPEIPASGTGVAPAWRSSNDINWDLVETVIAGRSSSTYGGINSMKFTADASNAYILLDINKSYFLDNAGYNFSNLGILFVGDGSDSGSASWMWSTKYQSLFQCWLKTGNALSCTPTDGALVNATANESGDHIYYEIAVPRSEHSAFQGTMAYIGFVFNKQYKIGSTVYNDPVSEDTYMGYAPTPNGTPAMAEVSLPTYTSLAPAPLPANLTFTEAEGDVTNPERGFYKHFEYHFDSSDPGHVNPSISAYTFDETLALTIFYLEDFVGADALSSDVITKVETELAALRSKGKKAIVRFAYTAKHPATSYEPTKDQIINHLDQLKAVFTAYDDVVYLFQAGFIGTYGEWYYVNDDFTYSKSGSALVGYQNRIDVVNKMLSVTSRQIAVRTPFYKRGYLYPSAYNTTVPGISSWGTEPNNRIGYYNDGFRGSSSDVGTFESDQDREQWFGQGEWLVCGGESAYVGTDSNGNGTLEPEEKQAWLDANPTLANPDNSIAAMRQQHWSYMHNAETNILMDYWAGPNPAGKSVVSCGTDRIPDFKKALGYRLVINSADFTGSSLESGATVNYSISIQNKGCARVIYPRPCKLVLIHNGTPAVLKDNLTDVRNLAPGASATVLEGSFTLLQNVYKDDKLAIWLPDNATGLQATPAYSIHLANSDVTWENGYNIIHTF